MRILNTAVVVALALWSCGRPELPPPASKPNEAQGSSSPVTVMWREVELGSGSAVVRLAIQKNVPLEKDLAVTLKIPAGATVEPATLSWVIAAADTGLQVREIRVRWIEQPVDDLVAVADAQGQSFGVHASAPYRFGRITSPAALPSGAPLNLGPHGLGKPVDVSKP